MSTPVAAGRPSTLTPEQEIRLKELWAACLKVFGVDHGTLPSTPDTQSLAPSTDDSNSSTTGGVHPKKKSLGSRLLRRSGKEDHAAASAASEPAAAVAVADDDDKYGQSKDFKAALESKTPAELRGAFWSMVQCDNPDALLLRFLRARKWDVDKALVMMISTMAWRLELDVCTPWNAPSLSHIRMLTSVSGCCNHQARREWRAGRGR